MNRIFNNYSTNGPCLTSELSLDQLQEINSEYLWVPSMAWSWRSWPLTRPREWGPSLFGLLLSYTVHQQFSWWKWPSAWMHRYTWLPRISRHPHCKNLACWWYTTYCCNLQRAPVSGSTVCKAEFGRTSPAHKFRGRKRSPCNWPTCSLFRFQQVLLSFFLRTRMGM